METEQILLDRCLKGEPRQETARNRIILDTSVWLLACTHKTEGDNRSGIDRQLRQGSCSRNPKKYRGFLAKLLVDYEIIIPNVILRELKTILRIGTKTKTEKTRKFIHQGNYEDLEVVIQAMDRLTTKISPTKEQVIQQEEIWDTIHFRVEPNRWKKKFAPNRAKVEAAAEFAKTLTAKELWPKTKQEWRSQAETSEKLRELQAIPSGWANLVEDYEILLVSQAKDAPVLTRDKDFQLIWQASTELSKNEALRPVIIAPFQDYRIQKTSVQKLGEAIRQNSKITEQTLN